MKLVKLTGKVLTLRRARRRWEDSIIMDLKEISMNARNLVDSAQNNGYSKALVNAALSLRVP
jgi:hypothetical protein